MANVYDDQFKRRASLHGTVCDPVSASIIAEMAHFLEAAAAQLAEKEREFRSLQKSYEDVWNRAEAAEERLKESQAAFVHLWAAAQKHYASPSGLQSDEDSARRELGHVLKQTDPSDAAVTAYDKLIYPLGERLRQREAELEQVREQISGREDAGRE